MRFAKWCGMRSMLGRGCFLCQRRMARLLQAAFIELAGARYICVELLRALVGIWSFGAQLRRELYSIPFTVYHLLDVCEGQFVRLWPSVRRELIAMARAVDFMCLQAADPVSRSVYATDAMGADDVDCGGFGVCVAQATREEFLALMRAGEEPGLSLADRDRGFKGLAKPGDFIQLTRALLEIASIFFR